MEMQEKKCNACQQPIIYDITAPEACPHCHETYWHKPGNERRLFQLQKSFFDGGRTNSKHELDEMYPILCHYTMNITKQRIRNSGRRSMKPEQLIAIAQEMSTRIIQTYLEKPQFKMKESFGAFLKLVLGGVMNPMTDPYERRTAFSFDQTIGDSDVGYLEHPDQAPVFVQKSSERMEWEEATTLRPKINLIDVHHDIGGAIFKFDDKVFYHHGWAASMLFIVGFNLKLRDHKSRKKIMHLQNQYDRIPVHENLDQMSAFLRKSILEGL